MKIAILAWFCGFFMTVGEVAIAQIATDGTAGDRVILEGDDIEITEDLGTRTGDNLFHSFEQFSISEGQIATFSGADAIEHVISRVTGGDPSDIDGTLRSTIAGADFWFFNPAGIAFGQNARLDIGGSLHVSTADEVTFADGASFDADLSSASSFTAASPEAFGFLGSDPAAISIDRSTLEVPSGETFSIVGGNITITGDDDPAADGGKQGLVRAEGGTVNLLASGGPGVATIDDGTLSSAETATIALNDHAQVDTSGDGGGSIRIRGGALTLDDASSVSADNTGVTDATGGIDIEATSISAQNGSQIRADVTGSGDGGTVRVDVEESIDLLSGGEIRSETRGGGDTTLVQVEADSITISGSNADETRRSGIGSEVGFGGSGDAGAVIVDASQIELSDFGLITSSSFGTGDGGDVAVNADQIQISSGALIRTSAFDNGDAGSIAVTADLLTIDGTDRQSGIVSEAAYTLSNDGTVATVAEGNAGDVSVEGDNLVIILSNEARISSTTFGPGDAGSVTVHADTISIDGGSSQQEAGILSDSGLFFDQETSEILVIGQGAAGPVKVTANDVSIKNGGRIRSGTRGLEDGGSVDVTVLEQLTILGNGVIGSTTTAGEGDGGAVTVRAGTIVIDGEDEQFASGILSNAAILINPLTGDVIAIAQGGGGNVNIEADEITISNLGSISSGTISSKNAGSVTVKSDSITLNRGFISSQANVFLSRSGDLTVSDGSGGDVIVDVKNSLDIKNNGNISSSIFGAGNAGSVDVDAGSINLAGGDPRFTTGISSNAGAFFLPDGSVVTSSGNAGAVDVHANGDISILDASTISSSTFGDGDAGQVNVSGQMIRIDADGSVGGSGIFSEASQTLERSIISDGNAGSVAVNAESIFIEDGGAIRASTAGDGAAGAVDITASHITISSELAATSSIDSAAFAIEGPPEADAGGVTITVDTIDIGRKGQVSSEARGQGTAGSVSIIAYERLSMDEGRISTTSAQGGGGVIDLEVGELVDIKDSEISTSVAAGTDPTAGDITITNPEVLVIQNSTISADAPEGFGGNIRIVTDNLLQSPESVVSASGEQTGTVTVVTREQDVAGQLAEIDASLVDASSLLRDRCAARRNVGASSFSGAPAGRLLDDPDKARLTGSSVDRPDDLIPSALPLDCAPTSLD